ncbi:hypothetical protein HII31_05847 [Pseudocercospora fuligena]|uniref:Beta-galactosidase trimerisation domain-containing protein n=1 Tax=Pseudocercospora fuligena TaxID=685502 RepID=A0A8H6RKP8_9PEZI|nr:hypothetical protein HII31_05847 [Pseudocercospora fuligena]
MGDLGKSDERHWWQKPFGMLQTNLREIDVDMDVDKVADYIQDYGADAWLIGVGGIQAHYPTKLDFHTRNPRIARRKSGDLIQDALQAAESRHLRLLARMDFSKVSAERAEEHPDWCYRSPTGKLQTHTGGLVSVCPNAEYYQERLFDILDEVTRRYHVDGFFINWTSMNEEDYYKRYHGVCHCSSCLKKWQQASGDKEYPKGPRDEHYSEWLQFSRDAIDELTGRIRAFIVERLPSACLILGKSSDIMFHEANNAVGRELWHHATSETVSTWMSYRSDVPVLINSTTFMDMPYRIASEEPAHFAQYLLQAISRGGRPSTYMIGVPGRIPYLCMTIGSEIMQFYKKWRSVYHGLRPCAKTALVHPDRAQMTHVQFGAALSEYRGLYRGMAELHVPFDVVAQEHLAASAENGGLQRYRVVILPDMGKLSADDTQALDHWVEAGGHLVATASSGVADDGDIQLKCLPINRQLNIDSDRHLLWSSYYAESQDTTNVSQHVYSGPLVPLYGTAHSFEWKSGSTEGYKLLAHAPFSPPEKAYGNIQVEQRGYGSWKYGNGQSTVIPFTVGRGYHELGLSMYRDFFSKVLHEEGSAEEPLKFDVPEQVEVTINKNAESTVVYLINMSGARKQNFGSHLPISGAKISVGNRNINARALKSEKQLEVKHGEIVLPTLDLFEVVVIEGLGGKT